MMSSFFRFGSLFFRERFIVKAVRPLRVLSPGLVLRRSLLAVPLCLALCEEDPYAALGVSKSASADEIRRAYKKKAAKAHPDRGGDAEEFKRIARAYAILSDDDKKRAYDSGGGVPPRGGGSSSPGGFSSQQFDMRGGDDLFDAFKLFEQFFAGDDIFESRGRRFAQMPTRVLRLRLSLEDLYRGGDYSVGAPRTVACRECGGRGATDIERCGACAGRGFSVTEERYGNFIRSVRSPCGRCGGAGQVIITRCQACGGAGGHREENHTLQVKVAKGAKAGDRFDFPNEGDVLMRNNTIVGQEDIVVLIEEKEHPEFQRLGADLLVAKRISLLDALTRVNLEVTDISKKNKKINISLDAASLPVSPDDVFRVRNEGMPLDDAQKKRTRRTRGDLYVRFIVDFPQTNQLKKGNTRALIADALGYDNVDLDDDRSSSSSDNTTTTKKKKGWSFEDIFSSSSSKEDQADDANEPRLASRAPKTDVNRLFQARDQQSKGGGGSFYRS